MRTCNIRHEPGSEAQRKCAVHGRRMVRQVAANLTPSSLLPRAPMLDVSEFPADVAEDLLLNRMRKGYARDASVERLAEIVSDVEPSITDVKHALVDEGFENSVARAALVSEMVRGGRRVRDLSSQIEALEALSRVKPFGGLPQDNASFLIRARVKEGHSVEDSAAVLRDIVDSQPPASEEEMRTRLLADGFCSNDYEASLFAHHVFLRREVQRLDAAKRVG